MLPESALYISCHSLTCGRKGKSSFMSANNRHHAFVTALALSVEYNEEKNKKKKTRKKNKYIQKYHAKAVSLVFSGPVLPHVPSSCLREGWLFLDTHICVTSVSQRQSSLYTYMFLVCVSLGTASGSIQNKSYIHRVTTPPVDSTFSTWKQTKNQKL